MATFEDINNSSTLKEIFDDNMQQLSTGIDMPSWKDGKTKLNATNLNMMSNGISGLQYVVNETFPKIKSILFDIVSSGMTNSNTIDGMTDKIEEMKDYTTFKKAKRGSIEYVTYALGTDELRAVSIGQHTIATGKLSFVHGKYNIKDPSGETYAHIVGNGTSNSNRSNAYTLDWYGNAWYAGGITSEDNISSKGNITSDGTIYSKKGILLERGVNYGTMDEMTDLKTVHDGQLFVVIEGTQES